jgi:hypothetical protein
VYRDDPDNEPPATMPHLTEAKRVLTWGAKYNRSDLLGLSLAIQAKAFGTELGDCDKQILTATADLLLKNPHLVEDELVRVLSGRGIAGLLAEGAAEARRMDKRLHAGIQKAIADIYNKGKTPKDKERIDWKSGRVKAEPELQDA